MGQKTPSPSLRLDYRRGEPSQIGLSGRDLNRQYDLCWFKETKYYSDLFLKDFKYRQHIQSVCSQLPNSIYFGRVLSSLYPKKYNLHIFTCFQPESASTAKPKKANLDSAFLNSYKNECFQDFLSQSLRQSQFSISSQNFLGGKTTKFNGSPGNQANELVEIQNVSERFTKCFTDLTIVKTPHFESSAHFFNEILIQSFKKSNSYRRALQNCLKLAQKSPNIRGIRITCAGRFNGVERARLETRSWGQTSLQKLDNRVDYSAKPALTNAGLLGIKVWVSYSNEV